MIRLQVTEFLNCGSRFAIKYDVTLSIKTPVNLGDYKCKKQNNCGNREPEKEFTRSHEKQENLIILNNFRLAH